MRHPTYDDAQERFICENSEAFTVRELSDSLGLPVNTIHNIGKKNDLTFKKGSYARISPMMRAVPRPVPVKQSLQRPPTEYNQLPSPYGIASKERCL